MNVAVIGATGLIGKPVTEQLIKAGFKVTILTRQTEQAQAMFPEARVVQADLQNSTSICVGLQNQQVLYLSLSVRQTEKPEEFHTETDGMKTIIAAARAVGIRRIGYLSSLVMRYQGMNRFDWWVFRIKHEAVRLLKASDIPTTIFYPTTFMESFQMQTQGPFLALGGSSTVRLWFIAGQDYGRQVAKALRQSDQNSYDYVVQGPEAHTYEAAARLFCQHYHRKLFVLKAPIGALQFLSRFSRKLNYGSHILEAMNEYSERFEAELTWSELGRPTTTIKDFAQRA
ncbi:SDR family oxidoreductase [Spirosoma koreense]